MNTCVVPLSQSHQDPTPLKATDGGDSIRSRAIVVLGMHRGGTSALTRVLNLRGAALAQRILEPAPDNSRGFWEPAEIVAIHEEMLASAGSAWHDFSEFPRSWFGSDIAASFRRRLVVALENNFGKAPLLVLKDPRTCRFVPFWVSLLAEFGAEPLFVIAIRNPLEVAVSLKERDGFLEAKSLLLWLRHFVAAERDTRGFSRSFVAYEDLLRDWRSVVDRIGCQLSVHWPRQSHTADVEVEKFLSTEHRHHALTLDDVYGRQYVSAWVKLAFDWAMRAARGRHAAPEELDALYEAIATADKAFVPIIAATELDLGQAARDIEQITQGYSAQVTELQDLRCARQELTAQLEASRAEALQLTAQLEASRAEARQSNAQLEASRAGVHQLTAQLETARAEARRLAAQLEAADDDARQRSAALLSELEVVRSTTTRLPFPSDVMVAESALYELAEAVEHDPAADMLFTDEDCINIEGKRCELQFKTAWDPDLILGRDAAGLLVAYRKALLDHLGGIRASFDGMALSLYDLTLRVSSAVSPGHIHHIPSVLCHRLGGNGVSVGANAEKARDVVRTHLAEEGIEASVIPAPLAPCWNRIIWPVPDPEPLVSVIVPTRDQAELLERCLDALLNRTDYPALEILVVDNDSRKAKAIELLQGLSRDPKVRILPYHSPFNYSAINNFAARQASGDILLLLNNDIDAIEADWLREMVSHAIRPDVGAVGAKLLYLNERVQHAAVVLGAEPAAVHQFRFAERFDPGPSGELALTRSTSAVTGACLALRRSVYFEVGGLDENLRVAFSDVDLCARIGDHGYRVVWTPFAELFHLESASRGYDTTPEKLALQMEEAKCPSENKLSL